MSFFDSIFGGESTKGIRFQDADNKRRQDFIEAKTEQARQDVQRIMPQGEENLRQGYEAATDVSRRATGAQIDALRGSNKRAQENILAGMGEYRRAIMGLPSQQNYNNFYENKIGLRPVQPAGGVNGKRPFAPERMPDFLSQPISPEVPEQASQDYLAQLRQALAGNLSTGGFDLFGIGQG